MPFVDSISERRLPQINKNNTNKSFRRGSNYTWSYCGRVLCKNRFMMPSGVSYSPQKHTEQGEGLFPYPQILISGLIFQTLHSKPAFLVQQRQDRGLGLSRRHCSLPWAKTSQNPGQGGHGDNAQDPQGPSLHVLTQIPAEHEGCYGFMGTNTRHQAQTSWTRQGSTAWVVLPKVSSLLGQG